MADFTSGFSTPVPDVLEGWQARTLTLGADGGAPDPVATLVERPGRDSARAALYLHGFVDYFFQTHHANLWEEAGFAFHALDLRDYGRSIRPGRAPNRVLDLDIYDEEITAALSWLRARHSEVVLVGHSTGGLIASRYASRHPGTVSAVVLNSPWLDLNEPWYVRALVAPAIRTFGHLFPDVPVAALGSRYGRSLHTSTGGPWEYDLRWKPLEGFGITAGWLAAILLGHRDVARGLDIPVPVF